MLFCVMMRFVILPSKQKASICAGRLIDSAGDHMARSQQSLPPDNEPQYPLLLLILLGAAGGSLVADLLVYAYFRVTDGGGGDAGFALIGQAFRGLILFGLLGAVGGALLVFSLATPPWDGDR